MMEKLTVDAEGRIIIPSEVIRNVACAPGDELTLVESDEGLLVYQGGVDEKTSAWWNRLDDRQRLCLFPLADFCKREIASAPAAVNGLASLDELRSLRSLRR